LALQAFQSVGATDDLKAVSHIDVSQFAVGKSSIIAVRGKPVFVWRVTSDVRSTLEPAIRPLS